MLNNLGILVLNHPDIIRWNLDKTYLQELEKKGVPCVPTIWCDQKTNMGLVVKEIEKYCWKNIIIKPSISNNARSTFRFLSENVSGFCKEIEKIRLQGCSVLIQPFLEEIISYGEISFIFFSGKYSHAILKRPKDGDYRVQHTHGGSYTAILAPAVWIKMAENVARLHADYLYCRVDMIPTNSGLLLNEIEMIDPYLHLADCEAAPENFAKAIVNMVSKRKGVGNAPKKRGS
jgi:glutathione synthase/RimK-type ligase-like ATP-grasp enzyme